MTGDQTTQSSNIVWGCLLIVAALVTGYTILLVPAMLVLVPADDKTGEARWIRAALLVAAVVVAMGSIGLRLGRDMALRDNVPGQAAHDVGGQGAPLRASQTGND